MKYCSVCGNSINEEGQKFCENCGAALQVDTAGYEAANQNDIYGDSKSSDYAKALNKYPMKWFKFLIYFALFFGAFIELVMGLNYIMGTIYFAQTNGKVSAEMVYAIYGTPLKIWDVAYGLIMLGAAVFSIITRFALSKYKKNGPKFLYIVYIAGAVLGLIYNIGVVLITGVDGTVIFPSFVSMIMTGIIVFANYKYFSKRSELFCNGSLRNGNIVSTEIQ